MSAGNGAQLSTLREDSDDVRQSETLPRAATGTRVYRKSILRQSSSVDTRTPDAGPSSLPQVDPVTPTASRRSSLRRPARYSSEPTLSQVPETPTKKGKRKAEDIDLTPPDPRNAQHTTFAIPPDHRRQCSTSFSSPLSNFSHASKQVPTINLSRLMHHPLTSENAFDCPPHLLLPVRGIPGPARLPRILQLFLALPLVESVSRLPRPPYAPCLALRPLVLYNYQ